LISPDKSAVPKRRSVGGNWLATREYRETSKAFVAQCSRKNKTRDKPTPNRGVKLRKVSVIDNDFVFS